MSLRHALASRTRPHFALLLTGAVLLVCLRLMGLLVPNAGAPSGQVVTVFSALPAAVRSDPALQHLCTLIFLVSSLLWLVLALLPWSAVAAALSFTAAAGLWEEQSFYVDHMFHLCNLVLVILAGWQVLYRREIRAALRGGSFWLEPLVPGWLPVLLVAHVGWFYSLGGLAKLQDSGLPWANGVSLQLWTAVWGRPGALTGWVMGSRGFAQALQAVTLLTESCALPLVLWRRTRTLAGVLLLGFHLGQQLLFGWWFVGNMVVIALVLLPVAPGVDRAAARLSGRGEPVPARLRWLLTRLDVRGRYAPAPGGALT